MKATVDSAYVREVRLLARIAELEAELDRAYIAMTRLRVCPLAGAGGCEQHADTA